MIGRSAGRAAALDALRAHYQLSSVETLGWGADEKREIRYLNRIISLHRSGLRWEADPNHVETLLSRLGLEEARAVTSPCVVTEGEKISARALELRRLRQVPLDNLDGAGGGGG